MKKLCLLISFLVSTSSFAGEIESGSYKPFDIIANDFSMNNKPAFSISFGKTTNDYFSLSVQCRAFDKKSSKTSTKDNPSDPEISLEYMNNDKNQFMVSDSKFDDHVNLEVLIKDKTFIFVVDGKLYDTKSNSLYTIHKQNIVVSANEMREIRNGCSKR